MKQTQTNQETPFELEVKKSFKLLSRLIGYIWVLAIVVLVIVPLFDFKGNQVIVSTAYLFVFLGLVYFLFIEFGYNRSLKWYSCLYKKFHKE